MYLNRIVVVAVVVISFMGVALSDYPSETPLHIQGLGMTSCYEIANVGGTDSGQGTKRIELEAWAQGFISGLGVAKAQQFIEEVTEVEGTPISIIYNSDGDWDWYVDHCQKGESANFAEAVMARWEEEVADDFR